MFEPVKRKVDEYLESKFKGEKYNAEIAPKITPQICNEIQAIVKGLSLPTYIHIIV